MYRDLDRQRTTGPTDAEGGGMRHVLASPAADEAVVVRGRT